MGAGSPPTLMTPPGRSATAASQPYTWIRPSPPTASCRPPSHLPAGSSPAGADAGRARGGRRSASRPRPGPGRTGGASRHQGSRLTWWCWANRWATSFPLAALAVRSQLPAAVPEEAELFSTFGGNPVACAAALAVLAVIEDEGLAANAAKVGSYLRRGLLTLAERHPLIGDVRGEGLLLGVELTDEARGPAAANARQVTEAMRERGILLSATGPAGNVLKIRPPLVFQHEHADLFLQALDEVLAAS